MKKILVLIAATIVSGFLIGCGGSEDMSSPPASTNSAAKPAN